MKSFKTFLAEEVKNFDLFILPEKYKKDPSNSKYWKDSKSKERNDFLDNFRDDKDKIDVIKYKGSVKEGLPNGKGYLLFPEKNTLANWDNANLINQRKSLLNVIKSYLGNFKNGIFDGKGEQVFFYTGDMYEGEFKDGEFHGYGELRYNGKLRQGTRLPQIYKGEYENGKRHGKGTLVYQNLSTFEGQWENGESKKGVYTRQDGAKYEGVIDPAHAVVEAIPQGKGTLTWSDGSKYVGGIWNFLEQGNGTKTWSDGRKYEGGWMDGKYHRKGTLTDAKGNKKTNDYFAGKIKKK